MKWIFYIILLFTFPFYSAAKGLTLPGTYTLNASQGLLCDTVYHLLPLSEGGMALTTYRGITLINAEGNLQNIPYPSQDKTTKATLSHYLGATHVYEDTTRRLWIKSYHSLTCLDLKTHAWKDLTTFQGTDLFVDGLQRTWVLQDSTRLFRLDHPGQIIDLCPTYGYIQDIEADSSHICIFYSSGCVAVHDAQTFKEIRAIYAYPAEDNALYNETSLVVKGPDGNYYQLRCGKKRNIFLRFNPHTLQWQTIFETSQGIFHTLCVPTPETALIACPQGFWRIDIATGAMRLHTAIALPEGGSYQGGYNGICVDEKGSLWLATYHQGVIHADSYDELPLWQRYLWLIVSFAVLIVVIGWGIYRYTRLKEQREADLLAQIRELMNSRETQNEPDESDAPDASSLPALNDEEARFIAQAVALVEANLGVDGYNVEQLSKDLCMERTGLYKKLKSILDQTPTLFIREVRLKHAARLIREGTRSITEIAELTGFSSGSYFSKCFYERYGCKPSEYAKTQEIQRDYPSNQPQ